MTSKVKLQINLLLLFFLLYREFIVALLIMSLMKISEKFCKKGKSAVFSIYDTWKFFVSAQGYGWNRKILTCLASLCHPSRSIFPSHFPVQATLTECHLWTCVKVKICFGQSYFIFAPLYIRQFFIDRFI